MQTYLPRNAIRRLTAVSDINIRTGDGLFLSASRHDLRRNSRVLFQMTEPGRIMASDKLSKLPYILVPEHSDQWEYLLRCIQDGELLKIPDADYWAFTTKLFDLLELATKYEMPLAILFISCELVYAVLDISWIIDLTELTGLVWKDILGAGWQCTMSQLDLVTLHLLNTRISVAQYIYSIKGGRRDLQKTFGLYLPLWGGETICQG